MKCYRVVVPFIHDMGSIAPFMVRQTTMETRAEAALWEINSMRRHDGLRELDALPAGTKFDRVTP